MFDSDYKCLAGASDARSNDEEVKICMNSEDKLRVKFDFLSGENDFQPCMPCLTVTQRLLYNSSIFTTVGSTRGPPGSP